MGLVNPFLRLTQTTDFFLLKSSVLRACVVEGLLTKSLSLCNQLWHNSLDNDFQGNVGKELHKQFPEPLSVGKLDVGNLHSQILQTLCKPEIT